MKKLILLLIIWSSWLQCHAPESNSIPILEGNVVYIYGCNHFEYLFIRLESTFIEDATHPVTGASGILQIMPVMIDEVNRICQLKGLNKRYRIIDSLDPYKSLEIFRIVQNYHNPHQDIDLACQIWFGRGKDYKGENWEDYKNRLLK